MAWFNAKNAWGNFPDLAGAVNKLQESVKSIEKNFDNALGFEEKDGESSNNEQASESSGSWPIPTDGKALFNPVLAFMGNKGEEDSEETSENVESSKLESEPEMAEEKPESLDHVPVAEGKEVIETDKRDNVEAEEITVQEENKVHETEEDGEHVESVDGTTVQDLDHRKDEQQQLPEMPVELPESPIQKSENSDSISNSEEKEIAEVGTLESPVMTQQPMVSNIVDDVVEGSTSELGESRGTSDVHDTIGVETEEESKEEERVHTEENVERISSVQPERSDDTEKRDDTDTSVLHSIASEESNSTDQSYNEHQSIATPNESSEVVSDLVSHDNETIVEENERVGVPFGNDHKGCKLVVTSRDLNVLNCEIGTQKEFRLDVLLEEDSWQLFEKMAGDVVQEFNIKPIAIKVARCCVGLPLLIVTVAKALRRKHLTAWKDALNELERFDQEGLHKKVYSTLELSYNCLEREELKLLFLFIGSAGVDYIHTGELFSCSWGFGLYRHLRTLTDARNKCYKLINDLKASSLLLESEAELVKMHDVVREVAKSIASRLHPTYGVQRYTVFKKWPKIDQLQKLDAIVVPWSFIHQLPEKLDCPELKLLVLQTIGDHLKMPDEFFSVTTEIKVLNLYGMMLTPSPPPSLRLLTNIQSLALSGCLLGDISIVAELKSLEILILEKSDITDIPKEIGQLANLRMLNLNNCSRLRFIPANLISSLTSLEELYMGNCFIQWNVKGSKYLDNNASLDELKNLSHLTTLDIMIQDASVWPKDLQVFEKLERYNIFIGDMWKWSLYMDMAGGASESSRTLKLTESGSSNILLDKGCNLLLTSAEDMCLAKLHCGRDVLSELNREGFPQLKYLCIQDSAELKYIIKWVRPYPAFLNLETLVLQNLFNLEEICHGPIPIQSLARLKSIEVKGCDKLKNLLWYSVDRDLPQLLEIKVSDCKMITEIIAVQTSEANKKINKIMFPKLRSLELECLPGLISLCSMPSTVDKGLKKSGANYDSTQSIPVALIDQKVEIPHLEILKLSMINSRKLWDDKLPVHSCIQNLRSLKIDKCGSIVYAFSSSVARELVNLEYLGISNCEMLEEIFVSDGKLGNLPSSQKPFSNDEVIFPNLDVLEISHMEHLKSVWHNKLPPNSFCKLKQLKIQFCNELSNVFPSFVLDKLQSLKTVTISDCPTLEVVFETQSLKADGCRQTRLEMQLGTLTLIHLPMLKHIWSENPNKIFMFDKLFQLKVTKCTNLNHVFPLSVAKELQHLQVLHIEKCGIEIVVAQDEMADTIPMLIFPKLTTLCLRKLAQLRSFYQVFHTLDFPVLRDVDVLHCDKLLLFKPESLNIRDIVPVDTLPLLSIEKVVTNTRELILNHKEVAMLCSGPLDEPIYTVKALRLRCFHDESDKFPSGFLQRFINLENLKLSCSSFKEIFSSGCFGIGQSETTMKLRNLVLVKLNNLKFICEEKSEVQPIIENLESLGVYRCSRLKNIVPSLVSFENLVHLEVHDCAGLENIMKSSTVGNILKLRKLYIYGCEKIEEIVASDDENDASELAFMKLEYLKLENLPKLKSFCKGRHDFKFPRLLKLVVVDCPMIETFSLGVLDAPRLWGVHVKEQGEWHWNGDINTTIRKFVTKTNSKDLVYP